MERALKAIVKLAENAAGVTAVHAPSPSAGEKIIYRCVPGKADGDREEMTVIMRFISRDLGEAMRRADRATKAICRPGDGGVYTDGMKLCCIREESSAGGYIGRTGHYYEMVRYVVHPR